MTVSPLNPADPPVVTSYHLTCLLACSDSALNRHISQGLVPRPDARVTGNGKVWKLSAIRQWRPDIADAVLDLLTRPPIRLLRYLPTAA